MAQQTKATKGATKAAQTKKDDAVISKTPKKPSRIDESTLIYVKSNTFGGLTYVDRRSGEIVNWDFCGDVQPVTMSLLRTMKASAAIFFTENKILVDFVDDDEHTPEDVYNTLAVSKYYKDIIAPEDFDKVCNWSLDEINKRVSLLSTTAKENLVVALNTFIEDGRLDSLKKIRAFSEALGCDLMKSE